MATEKVLDSLRMLLAGIDATEKKAEEIENLAQEATSDLEDSNKSLNQAVDDLENSVNGLLSDTSFDAALEEAKEAYELAGALKGELDTLRTQVEAVLASLTLEGKSDGELAVIEAESKRDVYKDLKKADFEYLQGELEKWTAIDSQENRHSRDVALNKFRSTCLELAAAEEALLAAQRLRAIEKATTPSQGED